MSAEGQDDSQSDAVRPPAPRPLVRPGDTPVKAPAGGLLAPSTLQPVELDLRLVFWVCTALWFVAGVVCAVLVATGQATVRTLAISAVGFVLGLAALLWEARRRRR